MRLTWLKHYRKAFVLLLSAAGLLCALAGCQSLPRSGIDPYGERLFESHPFANCPLFNRQTDSSPPIVSSTPVAVPYQPPNGAASPQGVGIFTPPAPQPPPALPNTALPGNLGAATHPVIPQYGSTATALPPGAHAVTTAMIYDPDAGPSPIFADAGGYALPTVPVSGPALIMTPREQIAPLGSEVVLIASRLGSNDRLVTNEKIEWALEGVGTIEKFDPGFPCDVLFFDYVKAKKVTDRYAITKTSQKYQTLTRGSLGTSDNVNILRGQTWITVNSMKEGTAYITAFAPNMADWSRRTDVGIIHWVDAQWVLPRLAIAPVGESRVLTTTVLHATNGQPRHGWIVRYEILNGPGAGLGASGTQIEEVVTDFSGQATTILTPHEQRTGTNTIGIQIIRPAGQDGDRRITVGSEMVRQTWSGSPNILLNVRGPNVARPDQELHYEITAENRTSSTVPGVVLLPIPPLASYIRSEPPGVLQGSTVQWDITLLPHSTERIGVVLRQGTTGSLWLRPEFRQMSAVIREPATASPMFESTTPIPATQPPALEEGASVFHGTTPTPPPISSSLLPHPPESPPTTFTAKPSLSVQMEPHPLTPVTPGNPFVLQVHVANTGMVDAKNMTVFIPLPQEFRGQEINAGWALLTADGSSVNKPAGWDGKIDLSNHQALLMVPTLSAGETAQFLVEYPGIEQRGHDIICTVHADGEQITQATRRIAP